MDDATLAALRTAAAAVFDIAFAAMAGALATPALLHDASSSWAARHVRRCRLLFTAAASTALLASLAWMAAQAIAMTDLTPADALLAIGGIVADTGFGRAWMALVLALAASLALATACRYRAFPLRTLGVVLAVIAVAHACTGHAAANGLGWLVPTMAVHRLATGLWAGGVFAAALVLRGAPDAVDCARYARRLSRLATAALAAVVVTGAASAWHALGGSLAPLAPAQASAWSVALEIKLALVAAAIALGGVNRFVVMQALPGAWPRFARVLRVESGVLLAALAVAAWLAGGEPPAV
ncbi:MAG TPA: CopD family protein [Burkholderiaceae bacterium]|jgi:putative copper resistance protein D|nr:CopD family protein [Burkholderiaceae bacterium]